MTIAATSPLTTRIQAVLDARSMLNHMFYQAWTAGTLPRERMQAYARQYYHFEAAFPRLLSAIHTRTESPAIRQMLIDNLWDGAGRRQGRAARPPARPPAPRPPPPGNVPPPRSRERARPSPRAAPGRSAARAA